MRKAIFMLLMGGISMAMMMGAMSGKQSGVDGEESASVMESMGSAKAKAEAVEVTIMEAEKTRMSQLDDL